jgi:hypothetical protein
MKTTAATIAATMMVSSATIPTTVMIESNENTTSITIIWKITAEKLVAFVMAVGASSAADRDAHGREESASSRSLAHPLASAGPYHLAGAGDRKLLDRSDHHHAAESGVARK